MTGGRCTPGKENHCHRQDYSQTVHGVEVGRNVDVGVGVGERYHIGVRVGVRVGGITMVGVTRNSGE